VDAVRVGGILEEDEVELGVVSAERAGRDRHVPAGGRRYRYSEPAYSVRRDREQKPERDEECPHAGGTRDTAFRVRFAVERCSTTAPASTSSPAAAVTARSASAGRSTCRRVVPT